MIYLFLVFFVLLGYSLYRWINISSRLFRGMLVFSGSFLLSQLIFDMLPKVYLSGESPYFLGLFIIFGIFIQLFLDFFSKGIEHGHLQTRTFSITLFLGLCIHSVIEGASLANNFSLTYGILMHKIPIAIVLMITLMRSKTKKWLQVLFLVLFALMSPLGMLIVSYINFSTKIHSYLLAIVVGLLLHVSTVILFETMPENHSFSIRKAATILLGVGLASALHIFVEAH